MTKEEAITKIKRKACFGGHNNKHLCQWADEGFGKCEECENYMAIQALSAEPCEDAGEISDGYHTFNQLYHQRAILFATIVNEHPDISWKSFKHSDGQYCFDSNGEWFIVGIDTPQGSYTYHYAKEYWEYFHCQELECGKEWDGHTEDDVTRLLTLKAEPCEDCISRQAVIDALQPYIDANKDSEDLYLSGCGDGAYHALCKIKSLPSVQPIRPKGHWIDREEYDVDRWKCSECGNTEQYYEDFCPSCGADMRGEENDK